LIAPDAASRCARPSAARCGPCFNSSTRSCARGWRLWSAIASELCQSARRRDISTFDHILVDEAQFMAPASLRVIQLALRPGGSMFLLGVEELLSPGAHDRGTEVRARKLYMAMTRSCYRLSVVTAQALSDEALGDIFERRA
jgi:hypothetical protein